MESGTIITGIIIIFLFVLPFILVNKNKSKEHKKFLNTLFDLAQKNKSSISMHDEWNNAAIGIDKNTHQLFFIRQNKGDKTEISIRLSEIKKCKMINSCRDVNYKGGHYKVVDRLSLEFTFRDLNKPSLTLDFYNDEYDHLTLNGEMQMTEKWLKIINEEMNGVQHKNPQSVKPLIMNPVGA